MIIDLKGGGGDTAQNLELSYWAGAGCVPSSEQSETYNQSLSKIQADCAKEQPLALFSPTLTRTEAQTLLFHHIQMCSDILDLCDGTKRRISVKDIDFRGAIFLISQLKKLNIPYKIIGANLKEKIQINFLGRRVLFLYFLFVYAVRDWRQAKLFSKFKPKSKSLSVNSVFREHWDFRHFSESGQFVSEYFVDLYEQEKVSSIATGRCINASDARAFSEKLQQCGEKNVIPLDSFSSLFLIIKTLIWGLRCRVKLKKPLYIFKNRDFSDVIQLSCDIDYFQCDWISSHIERALVREFRKNISYKQWIYPFENHAWERIINYTAKKERWDGVIKGYQHSSFSDFLIQDFPTDLDKNFPVFPDVLLTSGEVPTSVYQTRAHFPCSLVWGCGLRQFKWASKEKIVMKSEVNQVIVYAFSVNRKSYGILIRQLIDLMVSRSETLYLRFHPIYDAQALLDEEGITLPKNVQLANRYSWQGLLEVTDLLIYDDNSVGMEVMVQGIPSLLNHFTGLRYSIDRLYLFDGPKWDVNGLNECQEFLDDFYQRPQHYFEKAWQRRGYFYKWFAKVTTEKLELMAKIPVKEG